KARRITLGMDVEEWLCTELHDVVGYSDKTLSQFILSLAKRAPSAAALHVQLIGSGIEEGPRTRPFAEALFQRMRSQGGKVGKGVARNAGGVGGRAAASVGERRLTNAELIRQSQRYSLVESDDEDYKRAISGTGDGNGTNGGKRRKEEKKEKREKKERQARKKTAEIEEDEEEDISLVRKRVREVTSGAVMDAKEKGEDERKQEELDEDIRERDAFVQRMLEKEDMKTQQKASGGGLSAEQIKELATTGA
ncbi:atp-dependent rna, partial [Nannochloropsis gaditana CCMP526]|uniref:atp-dependent rna n=1 Tax=Nannochloropsis gaditana (strain CCMP526) TaxID=1093141 RepID=UPI00029F7D66